MEDIFDRINKVTGITKYTSSEVITPKEIVRDMVDILPVEIFNQNTKFLDMAAKSGRFLFEIYKRLMSSKHMQQAFPDAQSRRQHILDNQLYGLATSSIAATIIHKQLYNDVKRVGNIRFTREQITKDLIQEAFGIMKFDVVIGNPPYNNDTYLDFVTLGHNLASKYSCWITPAKWQAKTDGKPKSTKKDAKPDKNETFREQIVPHMSKVVFYPDSRDIFDIAEWGGISYFLLDKAEHDNKQVKTVCSKNSALDSDFEPHDETKLTLLSHKLLSVIGKVGTLGEGFKQSLYVKNTDHGEITIDGTLGFKRQTFVGEQERGEQLKQAGYVEVMQGEKVSGYKKIGELFTAIGLDKYKIITTIIVSGNSDISKDGYFQRYFNAYTIKPYQVPKGSFPVLKYFNTEAECDSFISYTKTKLFLFLFSLGVCGTTLTKEFFRFIPDTQDWTMVYEDTPLPGYIPDKNGIYTDNYGKRHCALYNKYGLNAKDIEIIESIIKERKQ